MQIYKTKTAIKEAITVAKNEGRKVALIPTMGMLHEGHFALIKEARNHADFIIVSIFVNKIQFNDPRDYEKYPRDYESDLKKLEKLGVQAAFLPDHDEIYPQNEQSSILPISNLDNCLCGASRVGHFDGVRLVIAKLFDIIEPDIAVFGKKDYQQYIIIKELVGQLGLKVKIIGIDTIREETGLAMSSRNQLLSRGEGEIATNIYRILNEIKNDAKNTGNLEIILQNRSKELLKIGFSKIDYLEIRDQDTLELVKNKVQGKNLRIFIAIYLNQVRLIDNLKI